MICSNTRGKLCGRRQTPLDSSTFLTVGIVHFLQGGFSS